MSLLQRMYKKLLLLFITIHCSLNIFGISKIMGGDISYVYHSFDKYTVVCNLYRNCADSALDSTISIKISNNSSNQNITAALVKVTNNSFWCASSASVCNPSNTSKTGKGLEIFRYEVTINFQDTIFQTWLNSGTCKFQMVYETCCKDANVSAANNNIVLTAMLDYCMIKSTITKNNSALAYILPPDLYLNCNTPFYGNLGGIEINGDSLVYKEVCYGTFPATCAPNINVYCPFGSPCNSIPSANPPIGLYFDTFTADLIFMPTDCFGTGYFEMQAFEFRRDTNNINQLLGYTGRVLNFIVDSLVKNNPPVILPKYHYSICEGDSLSFEILSKDEAVVLSPPSSSPPSDTTYFSWSENIAGATFTILNPKDRERKVSFGWRPPVGSNSNIPYTFFVNVSDSACPKRLQSSYQFSIRVNKISKVKTTLTKKNCGKLLFEAFDSTYSKSGYNWSILTVNDSLLFTSQKQKDSFSFSQGGKYKIKVIAENLSGCKTTVIDTIEIENFLTISLPAKDTFICQNDSLQLAPKIANGFAPFSYKWLVKTSSQSLGTDSSINLKIKQDEKLSIQVTDNKGCEYSDTLFVKFHSTTPPNIGRDKRICHYDSANISVIKDSNLKYYWSTGESASDNITVKKAGVYGLTSIDIFGCKATSTVILYVNDSLKTYAGKDTTVCYNNTISLIGNYEQPSIAIHNWHWREIVSNKNLSFNKDFNLKVDKDFQIELKHFGTEYSVTCFDLDTVKIFVKHPNTITIKNQSDFCFDKDTVNLNQSSSINLKDVQWQLTSFNGFKSPTVTFANAANRLYDSLMFINGIAGKYIFNVSNTLNGCLAQDSFVLNIAESTAIVIAAIDTICSSTSPFSLIPKSTPNINQGKNGSKWTGIGIKNDSLFPANFTIPNETSIFYGSFINYLTYIDPINGCINKDSVAITIQYPAIISILQSPLMQQCENTVFNITAEIKRNISNYEWSTAGSGYFQNKDSKETTYTPSKQDIVNYGTNLFLNPKSYPISNKCPNNSPELKLQINPLPKADYAVTPKDTAFENDAFFNFKSLSNVSKGSIDYYYWNFGSGKSFDTSNLRNVKHYYPEKTQTYFVTHIVTTDWGCMDTIIFPVYVVKDNTISIEKLTFTNYDIFIPSAFAPESVHAGNAKFKIFINNFETAHLTIYNRWGAQVFESFDLKNNLWDGNYANESCLQDVYIYVLEAKMDNGEIVRRHGTVFLIR